MSKQESVARHRLSMRRMQVKAGIDQAMKNIAAEQKYLYDLFSRLDKLDEALTRLDSDPGLEDTIEAIIAPLGYDQ